MLRSDTRQAKPLFNGSWFVDEADDLRMLCDQDPFSKIRVQDPFSMHFDNMGLGSTSDKMGLGWVMI